MVGYEIDSVITRVVKDGEVYKLIFKTSEGFEAIAVTEKLLQKMMKQLWSSGTKVPIAGGRIEDQAETLLLNKKLTIVIN